MKVVRLRHAARLARLILPALIALCLTVSIAYAQDPARVPAFVYGITNYDGAKYASAIVPPVVKTMYLLSGRANVVAPRSTMIYWWPLTNEYLADWEKLNQVVAGTMDIYQGGRLFKSITLSPYIIQYDSLDPENTLHLYTGSDAQSKFDTWNSALQKYQSDLANYYQVHNDWQFKIDELSQASPNGVIPKDKIPPEPQQPVKPTMLSTNPAQGYVLDLPTGEYDIQVTQPDGSMQPDSRKHLVMFDKQREGISYSVVPSSRWNLPEQSDQPDSIIYAQPGTTLYLQAFQAGEYDDYAYAHMLDPQDQAAQPGTTKWVSFDPTTQPQLRLTSAGQAVGQVASRPYYVQQTSGGGLGYLVEPFDPNKMDHVTFTGYTIPLDAAGTDYAVQLVDSQGVPLAGSERRVIALDPGRVWVPYVLSALPLALGACVILWRRRQARRIHVDE